MAVQLRRLRGIAAAGACALVAHTVAYWSLLPADGEHGYLRWYAPLLAGFSAVAIVGIPLALAVILVLGRESSAARALGAFAPDRAPESCLAEETAGLAVRALGLLVLQETLEHSLSSRRLAFASFAPSTWIVLLAVLVLASVAVAFVGRTIGSLVCELRGRPRAVTSRGSVARRLRRSGDLQRRSRPLAVHAALRAPPALS